MPIVQRIYTQHNVQPTGPFDVQTYDLFVGGFDFGLIPSDAIITGITVTISRRSKTNSINQYVYSNSLRLIKDITDYSTLSLDDYAFDNTPSYKWANTFTSVTYPPYFSPPVYKPLWGYSSISLSELGYNFGVIFSAKVRNNTATAVIIPQIECITINVSYYYHHTEYTYSRAMFMDGNVKFDPDLYNFGKVSEFVFSKVNENKNILKVDQSKDTPMYPIIDEYGYTYSERFVFKSPWDREFFTRTNSSVVNAVSNNSTISTL